MVKPTITLKQLSVIDNQELTPNMRRLTFTSEAIADFPNTSPGAYIKLMFDFDGMPLTKAPASKDDAQLRTYTVRHVDREHKTLSVDFAMHGDSKDSGPASHWAQIAKANDKILFGGPGSSKELASECDWVLFVGDMTSLPAISNYLEVLNSNTLGYAVIQIPSAEDRQELVAPDNVKLIWVCNDVGKQDSDVLADAVRQLEWLPGTPAVWAACEFSAMRELRQVFRNEKALAHESLYISSYWRRGRSEDQHKIDKRKDAEQYASQQQ